MQDGFDVGTSNRVSLRPCDEPFAERPCPPLAIPRKFLATLVGALLGPVSLIPLAVASGSSPQPDPKSEVLGLSPVTLKNKNDPGCAAGHARIAEALAHALDLPGSSTAWREPQPTLPRRTALQVCAAETRWARHHLLPWIGRSLAGRSLADGRSAKRPALAPL